MKLILLLVCLVVPATGLAQTPCDGPRGDALFVLPPGAPGVSFVFSVRTIDLPTIQEYTMRFYRANDQGLPVGTALSVQSVTAAATTSLGVMQTEADQTCHLLPVIPVAQIPRGQRLVLTLSASGGEPLLASGESAPSGPLGQRLGAPAIRVKP